MLEAFVIRKGLGWRAGVAGRHAGETICLGFDFTWGDIAPTRKAAQALGAEVKLRTGVSMTDALCTRLAKAEAFRVTLAHAARAPWPREVRETADAR